MKSVAEFEKILQSIQRLQARAQRELNALYIERWEIAERDADGGSAELDYAREAVMSLHMIPTHIETAEIKLRAALAELATLDNRTATK